MAITDYVNSIRRSTGNVMELVGDYLGKPEGGWSERIAGGPTLKTGVGQAYASSGNLASSARNSSQTPYSWTPQKTTPVNRTYQSGGGGGGYQEPQGSGFDFTSGIQSPDTPFGGGPSEQDMINEQFNQFSSYLDQEEGRSKQNFNDIQSLYTQQKQGQEKQYATEKQTQTEDIKKTEGLNLSRVRQLLQDLQQRDAARTAITGGGSTSEVLAERFGREAQSRLGNVQDQTRQAIQRVNTFYDNAITKLNDSYNANILQAKQSLDENLSYIGQQRQASAQAKQQGIMNAWKSYYDQVNTAKTQAATFKAQYDLWKQQQDNAYAAVDPFNEQNAGAFNTGLQDSYSELPTAGVTQQQPAYSLNPQYRIFNPKKGQEDEEAQALGLNYSPMVGSAIAQ